MTKKMTSAEYSASFERFSTSLHPDNAAFVRQQTKTNGMDMSAVINDAVSIMRDLHAGKNPFK